MTITNVLGGFNRRLFVNLIAFLLVVTAGYLLCLISLQLALSGGLGSTSPTSEAIQVESAGVTESASMVSTAIALALGAGMLIVAFGLFRLTRWAWLGTLVVSAALVVLILLQVLSGLGFTPSAVVQLLVFAAIFAVFLLDNGIKSLLWVREEQASG